MVKKVNNAKSGWVREQAKKRGNLIKLLAGNQISRITHEEKVYGTLALLTMAACLTY